MKILIWVFFSTIALIQTSSASVTNTALNSITANNLLKSEKITITAEGKKGLVVVFLSAKCPCSNSHVTELNALSGEYPDFSFVGIHSNTDESIDFSKSYFEQAKLNFPVLQDEKSELANRYQALKTPHSFLILPDGRIAYQGGVSSSKEFERADRKYLREALNDIQNNRSVKTPEGRTLGCVIKREEKNVW